MISHAPTRPRVVIVGGGFGGLSAARALSRADVDITLVDRTNHHIFQPLLYQVATATLAPSDITAPIRHLVRKQRNTGVLLAEVTGNDVARRVVALDREPWELPYDHLILAAGARHSYFGHDEWEAFAPGLKSMDDALEIRRRFLLAFERAEATDDPAERAALLTFVIIGGGPTGVELAGLIPEVARGIRRDFRRLDTREARVVLLEGGTRLLAAFPESISERARRDIEAIGVEVRTGAVVTRVDEGGAHIGDEYLASRTVLWAAGNAGSAIARSLGVPLDRAGRVQVESDLSIPGHPEILVVGDLAAVTMANGRLVPGVAPAANQMGRTAAINVMRAIAHAPRRTFRYRDKGNLATIGRYRAVADFGRVRLTGVIAWWFWLFVHIMYLVGFRNRASVLVQWAYAYFTYQRGVRLIVGARSPESAEPAVADPSRVIAPRW
jgi:NADH dehydrogenase